MNYPPANVWHRVEPTIEQLVAPEPSLIHNSTYRLSLPAEWPEERRAEFLRRRLERK